MRHRLDQSGFDVLTGSELLAEAEDHQQRVVDRDAETDERNQELDDDRDVRDVGQQPHDRECVEDRRDRNRERNRDRRNRPEHEEKNHERSEAADQRLRQDTRAAAAAAARGVVERQKARERCLDARRNVRLQRSSHGADVRLARERVLSRRIDLGESRVPIARNVEDVVRIEVRADTRARVDGCSLLDRRRQVVLRDVTLGVENRHEWRLLSGPERLHRLLVRLVRGVARNRERLEPSTRDLHGREDAECGQQGPEGDEPTAPAVHEVGETNEHGPLLPVGGRAAQL